MKVKHTVTSTDDEVGFLFDTVMTTCLTVYSTIEEQSAAILAAKLHFKEQLDSILKDAFNLGEKIAMMDADYEDTKMYMS